MNSGRRRRTEKRRSEGREKRGGREERRGARKKGKRMCHACRTKRKRKGMKVQEGRGEWRGEGREQRVCVRLAVCTEECITEERPVLRLSRSLRSVVLVLVVLLLWLILLIERIVDRIAHSEWAIRIAQLTGRLHSGHRRSAKKSRNRERERERDSEREKRVSKPTTKITSVRSDPS
jgi:hypothetical protein